MDEMAHLESSYTDSDKKKRVHRHRMYQREANREDGNKQEIADLMQTINDLTIELRNLEHEDRMDKDDAKPFFERD